RRSRNADQSVRSRPARLLRGLRKTFLAQPVYGSFAVAVRLGERSLAVHHARAGLVAQVFHHSGSNICHRKKSFRPRLTNARRTQPNGLASTSAGADLGVMLSMTRSDSPRSAPAAASLADRPSMTARAARSQYSAIAREASSLPG